MALTNTYTVDPANKLIVYLSGGAVDTVRDLYSWLMDTFDELGALDDTIPMSAQTPTEFSLINGWFIDEATIKTLKSGAIQSSGHDGVIYVLIFGTYPSNLAAGDIGRVLTTGGGVHTGTILAYNDSLKKIWVRKGTATFADSDTCTITGGTAGNYIIAASSGVATGENMWSNIFTLGTIESGTTMDLYQNDAQITPWWGTGHIDILVKVKEAGTEIDSGNLTVLARKYGTLYDHYVIDASSGRNPVPLATFDDGNNETASTTVDDPPYTDLTFDFGAVSADVNGDTVVEPYDVQIDCSDNTIEQVYEYLKYVTRTGSGDTLNGVNGEFYIAVGDIRFDYDNEGSGPFQEGERIEEQGFPGGVDTYYFNDLTPTDSDGVWTNDTNAFDGSTATDAITGSPSISGENCLVGEGTDAPGIGGSITQVRARIYGYDGGVIAGGSVRANIYTAGLAENLGTAIVNSDDTPAWGNFTTLNVPSTEGGWTWSKVQSLETQIFGSEGSQFYHAHRVEIEVTSEAVGGGGAYGYLVSLIDNGATGTMVLRNVHGTFTDNLAITGATSTATADVNGTPVSITPSKQAPFGTFAGGKFFGARGVLLINVAGADANSYELIDSEGNPKVPPVTINLTISIKDADGNTITENCEVTVVKSSDNTVLFTEDNITDGTTGYQYTTDAGTLTYINVLNVAGYQPRTVNNYTLPSSSTTLNIQLDEDRFYSNP